MFRLRIIGVTGVTRDPIQIFVIVHVGKRCLAYALPEIVDVVNSEEEIRAAIPGRAGIKSARAA